MQVLLSRLGAAAAALTSVFAFAQAPLPSSTSARVTPVRLEYRSVFEGYRGYQEPEAQSWREANENAASLGGHAGHINPAAASANAAVSKPETDGGATAVSPAAIRPSVPAPSPAASTLPGSSASPAMKPTGPAHEGHGK